MANTKNDAIMAAHVAAGRTTGTINDRERQRLLAAQGLVEPQQLSLNDLYKRNGERPRLP